MTDHYAEAERLISGVGNVMRAKDRRQCLMEAQVHIGLASIDETRRMSALMSGVDEALAEYKAIGTRTIPWPPNDDLVDRVADACRDNIGGTWHTMARAMLDVVGGEQR